MVSAISWLVPLNDHQGADDHFLAPALGLRVNHLPLLIDDLVSTVFSPMIEAA